MSFWNRRKQSRRAAAATLDALEPRRLLAFEVGMGGAWSPAAIDEGGGVATFHVDRYDYDTGDYSQPLTVNLAVRGWDQGGASPASADDLAFPATATFAPGEWQTSFDVTAVDDLLPEPDEHYEMYVLPGSGYTTDPAWSRQSAIFASDTPNVWVEAAPPTATATEGGQAAQVTFRRDNASGPLTARFGLTGDAADVAAPGVPDSDWLYPVTFADGQAAVTVPLSAIDDADVEPTEQVSAYLVSNAYGTAGVDKYFAPGDEARPSSAMASIADDDVNVSLEGSIVTVGGTKVFTVRTTDYAGVGKSASVQLSGWDASLINPRTTTVTTDANGIGTVDIAAVAEGASNLVLAANGGAAVNQPVQAQNPTIHVGDMKTVLGGYYRPVITLRDAEGNPWGGQRMDFTVANANVATADASAHVPPGEQDPKTDLANGQVRPKVAGVALGRTTVVIKHPGSGVNVTVNIDVVNPVVTVGDRRLFLNEGERIVSITVTNGADPMEGVVLDLSVNKPNLINLRTTSGATSSQGLFNLGVTPGDTTDPGITLTATPRVAGAGSAGTGTIIIQ